MKFNYETRCLSVQPFSSSSPWEMRWWSKQFTIDFYYFFYFSLPTRIDADTLMFANGSVTQLISLLASSWGCSLNEFEYLICWKKWILNEHRSQLFSLLLMIQRCACMIRERGSVQFNLVSRSMQNSSWRTSMNTFSIKRWPLDIIFFHFK